MPGKSDISKETKISAINSVLSTKLCVRILVPVSLVKIVWDKSGGRTCRGPVLPPPLRYYTRRWFAPSAFANHLLVELPYRGGQGRLVRRTFVSVPVPRLVRTYISYIHRRRTYVPEYACTTKGAWVGWRLPEPLLFRIQYRMARAGCFE